MSNKADMICGDIKSNVKQFIDDRLVETEYKAFFRHLESCPECKEYVRSFGALSNHLWKLNEIQVPSDLSSTILFKLKRLGSGAEESRQPLGFYQKLFLGIVVLIVGFFAAHGVIKFFKPKKISNISHESVVLDQRNMKEQENTNHESVKDSAQAAQEQELVSEEEAKAIFSQLQMMARP